MSILIKGMEMPENCADCNFSTWNGFESVYCDVNAEFIPRKEWEEKRQNWCPLVEIKPHGRLIDADAYHKEIRERYQSAKEWYNEAKDDEIIGRAESAMITFTECSLTLQNMPTIIEGDDE